MKKIFFTIVVMMGTLTTRSQVIVMEPEFVNTYYVVTGENSVKELPKEYGSIQAHENKVSKFAKIAKVATKAVGAAGVIGVGISTSADGVLTSVKAVTTASGIADAASVADVLAGSEGMDIVFEGGNSSAVLDMAGKITYVVVRAENNAKDPQDLYRIVRFTKSKKDRRIQWMKFRPGMITAETSKEGYIPFAGEKYGEYSYLLTIPASELKKGEYGIFFMSLNTSEGIPVATFSVK